MKKDITTVQDELLPEYDLKKLRVRRVGPERKFFAGKPVDQLNPNAIDVLRYEPLLSVIRIKYLHYTRRQPKVITFH